MSLNEEDQVLSEVSFTDVVRNLQQTFEKRNDFERAAMSQQVTIQLNGIVKEQKKEVSKAVKQIRAAMSFDLDIDVKSLLISEGKSKAIMLIWNESVAESDIDKAERFMGDCTVWTDKVMQSVDKAWRDECERLLQSIKRHAGLLKSLKKFKQFEIEYLSHRDRLQVGSQRHAFLSKTEEIDDSKNYIKNLEDEINNLGSLPDGLLEFMDLVNSNDGVPFLTFISTDAGQTAIRKWLEENDFMGQLILKARV